MNPLPSLFCRPLSQDCLYPTTTEKGHGIVVQQLQQLPEIGNAILGVSGLVSLNIAAVREGITDVYIFDLADSVAHFWEKLVPILAECKDPKDAVQKIGEELENSSSEYFRQSMFRSLGEDYDEEERTQRIARSAISRLDDEVAKKTSFLSDPVRYTRIHELAKEGRIHFAKGDLTDKRNVTRIVSYFKQEGVTLDTIYLSNIQHTIRDLRQLEGILSWPSALRDLGTVLPYFVQVDERGRQNLVRMT